MTGRPMGKSWAKWIIVPIVLVAALFFFEWLGSEQPQKLVEVDITLKTKTGNSGESVKD
ncbi:hypothetical protein [Sphingorhabdus pulchriflava]|uniref:hypothetical protein n=1 Tax=Sphingorhabdus pulchriflava TaxID=2292257 RepID=UPI0015F13A77|nr:hypothetical protein [Sphingorhabdus pulchriflava]